MIQYTGEYPEEIWDVLEETLHGGLPLQGDFTRSNAVMVALAASIGYITTIRITGHEYGNRWYITSSGLRALELKGQPNDSLQALLPSRLQAEGPVD